MTAHAKRQVVNIEDQFHNRVQREARRLVQNDPASFLAQVHDSTGTRSFNGGHLDGGDSRAVKARTPPVFPLRFFLFSVLIFLSHLRGL